MRRLCTTLSVIAVCATEARAEEGPTVPQGYQAARYAASWETNPFGRPLCPPEVNRRGLGDDWALVGMARIGEETRVTLRNRNTGAFVHLTKRGDEMGKPGAAGLRLVSADFSRNRDEARARIDDGVNSGTLKLQGGDPK